MVMGTVLPRGANTTSDPLQVVCVWPVSGRYGPGSRILYYVLVLACLFARKVEWLKKACLAAALLLPAIAAIHGIVLAVLHTDGAVDMDIYGAFQLCAIGILAAPVTVKLSSTYFNDRGRNIIFAWTSIILAGLLSLTVEFYRSDSKPCFHDDNGNPLVNSNPDAFPYSPYGGVFTCGLICDIGPGNPYSPLRSWDDSRNNICVISAPQVLTFGAATLVAAACCLPALLSLLSMWTRIAEANWAQRFFPKPSLELDEMIDGTNGATSRQMKTIQDQIKKYLKIAVEIPIFGAAVLAIAIIGEMNFWSEAVRYMTEPIASIGQWGPIVGTAFAVFGLSYAVVAENVDQDVASEYSANNDLPGFNNVVLQHETSARSSIRHQDTYNEAPDSRRSASESEPANRQTNVSKRLTTAISLTDAGNRRKFAAALYEVEKYIGTPARKRFDLAKFQQGHATNYPEIPGEFMRNRDISRLRVAWTAASIREPSPDKSLDSNIGLHDNDMPQVEDSSTHSPQISTFKSPLSPVPTTRRSTMPKERNSEPLLNMHSHSPGEIRGRRRRRDTLEVPWLMHGALTQNSPAEAPGSQVALEASDNSPAIVISPESASSPILSLTRPSNGSPPSTG